MHSDVRGPESGLFVLTLLAGLLVMLAAAPCLAQSSQPDPELITDRPDFTESSEVVGRGVIQIESGLTLEEPDASVRQVTLPQLLVRIGLGRRVELRLASDGYVSQSLDAAGGRRSRSGRADMEVGAKVKLLDADRTGFDLALIPALTLPTASESFGSNGYDPGVKLTVARDLPREFGFSANLNTASVTEGDGRVWSREASVSVSHALAGAFGAYWETYGSFDGDGCDCTLNTGVTMALGANRQVDVEIGHGVSGDARGWFVGLGFAVRRLHH
jgi:hypothetical protein